MEETMRTWAETIKEKLMSEATKGGELAELPCPLCGRPRSQRSDYIRCTPCGINWSTDEDLTKDPKIERYRKMVDSQRHSKKSSDDPLNS